MGKDLYSQGWREWSSDENSIAKDYLTDKGSILVTIETKGIVSVFPKGERFLSSSDYMPHRDQNCKQPIMQYIEQEDEVEIMPLGQNLPLSLWDVNEIAQKVIQVHNTLKK